MTEERHDHTQDQQPTANRDQPAAQPQTRRYCFRFWHHKSIIAQPSTPEEQHHAAEQNYWRRSLRKQRNLNIITFVAAIAGIGGLLILYGTLSSTKEAANAAKQSADAAFASTRPWIVFTTGHILPIQAGESTPRFALTLINVGKTPAINLYLSSEFKYLISSAHSISIPSFDSCQKASLKSRSPNAPYLAANITVTINTPLPEGDTPKQRAALEHRTPFSMFLHECVSYGDLLTKEERAIGICVDVFTGSLISSCSELK